MPNPYVGPRPFEYGQPLFGRKREVAELRYLLTSERIVLLYSPSGAGKSSLINAGLIKEVESRFDIWGPTRVNTEAPATAANRYAWSAIAGLAKSETHSDITLAEYAASRPRTRNPLLIFDQFEEILRVDPTGIAAKQAFFAQLGELLSDPTIWALFILREDYLAPLDPYVSYVPSHLQNRFRIDRLKRDTAAEAILKPLEGTGRSFASGVVESLVANLATESSDYIEPLQLQVVCYDLWDRMDREKKSIIEATDLGDISSALRSYYDAAVFRPEVADERAIREWFETQLIAPDGVRLQVRGGLDPALITQLTDAWLIRPEPRGKTIWYELSHDRLIDPIRASNAAWTEAHLNQVEKLLTQSNSSGALRDYFDQTVAGLSGERAVRECLERRFISPEGVRLDVLLDDGPDRELIAPLVDAYLIRLQAREGRLWATLVHDRLVEPIRASNQAWFEQHFTEFERLARRWQAEDRNERNLLRGGALSEAEQWVRTHNTTPVEDAFLEACRKARTSERQRRIFFAAIVVVAVVAILAGSAALVFANRLVAVTEDSQAHSRRAVWQSWLADGRRIEANRSAAFAQTESELAQKETDRAQSEADKARTQEHHANHLLADQFVNLANQELGAASDSPAAPTLAYLASALRSDPASAPAHAMLADLLRRDWWVPSLTLPHDKPVQTVSWSADGSRLLTSATDFKVRIWNPQTGALLNSVEFPGPVRTAAYNPAGTSIVAVTTKPVVWTGNEFIQLTSPNPVDSAWFSSDGTRVIGSALSQEGAGPRIYFVWDLATRRLLGNGLHVSRDGRRIATNTEIRDVDTGKVLGPLPGVLPYLMTSGPDASAALFMSAGSKVWQMNGDPRQTMQLWADFGVPTGRELRSNSNIVFRVGTNNILTLYSWNFSAPKPAPREERLKHPRDLIAAVFGPGGKRILTACEDKTVRIWNALNGQRIGEPLFHSGLNAVALSPDDSHAATAADEGSAFIWSLAPGTHAQTLALTPADLTEKIADLRFSPDNRSLVAVSTRGIARTWNIAAGRLLRQTALPSWENAGPNASISPAVDRVLTVFDNKRVRIFDAHTGQPVCPTPSCDVPGFRADLTPDGRFFFAQTDHAGRFYDFTGRPHGAHLTLPGTTPALSPDGKLAAIPGSGPGQDEIHFLNVETGLPVGIPHVSFSARLAGFHKYSGVYFEDLLFTPEGRKLVVNVVDANSAENPCFASLRVVDLRSGQPVAEMCHAEHIDHVALSPDGGLVATASQNTVQLWSTLTGARTQAPMPHLTEVQSIAFSADGQFLVTTAGADTRMWDPATGKQVAGPFTFESVPGYTSVGRPAISPDSSLLAVPFANSIRVWNLKLGTPADAPLLAEIAEVIGGYTLDAHGAVVATPDRAAKLRSLRRQAAAGPPGTLTSYLRNLFHLSQ